jgi:hypothetical protein
MRSIETKKCSDRETAIRKLKECATEIRRREVPLSLQQQTTVFWSLVKLLRKMLKDSRRDVARWAAMELSRLCDKMKEDL